LPFHDPLKTSKSKPVNGKPPAIATIPVTTERHSRITTELAKTGITLSPAHRITLTVCATLAADINDCWAVLQANGSNYTTAGTGAVKIHPASARLSVNGICNP